MNTQDHKHKYSFHTNLKCSGCVAKLGPLLEREPVIAKWKVDLQHTDKKLEVELLEPQPGIVLNLVKEAGFAASLLPSPYGVE